MTASHVTDGAQTMDIRMADGTRVTGTLIGVVGGSIFAPVAEFSALSSPGAAGASMR